MLWKRIGFLLLPICFSIGGLVACSRDTVSLEEALAFSSEEYRTEDSQFDTGAETAADDQDADNAALMYVYVCGCVKNPGVYALTAGSRIVSAVEAAGGFLPGAAKEAINLAEPVADGMQITVPDIEEEKAKAEGTGYEEQGLVNLNTATLERLCTLKGIGEAKAEAILAYREEIGSFKSIEQLKDVSGIGDSLYKQIKDSIYIE